MSILEYEPAMTEATDDQRVEDYGLAIGSRVVSELSVFGYDNEIDAKVGDYPETDLVVMIPDSVNPDVDHLERQLQLYMDSLQTP